MQTKTIPAAALIFKTGPLHFRKLAAAGGDKQSVPVSMRARSGQAIHHWYWGRVAHDMTGFKAAAQSIPIDYCHDDNEILGYIDSFRTSNDGLDVAGEMVLFHAADRASEVLSKSQRGVPYQASIFFDPATALVEQIAAGQAARVNGYKLAGPATIIRAWTLRGVAICPYGADGNTHTRLSAGDRPTVRVRVLTAADRKIQQLVFAGLSEGQARYAAALSLPGRR